jgi:hypothetical protein
MLQTLWAFLLEVSPSRQSSTQVSLGFHNAQATGGEM